MLSRRHITAESGFYSFYDDGFPDYPFPKSQSNDEILDWLIATVASLRPFLPRPQQEKGIARLAMQLRQSSEMQENIWNKQGQVFISYRSRYYDEVKQLSEQIAAGQFHG
jgi:hypothetical protein